jgi:hypothetical protein
MRTPRSSAAKTRKGGRQTAFEDSFMRGVVASGQDALDILFDAARNEDDQNREQGQRQSQEADQLAALTPSAFSRFDIRPASISKASAKTLEAWNLCRFVRMGWLSADEAVTYVDMFFKHMNSLSPILTDLYALHEQHEMLIMREPFLCSAILMVSSRYFHLPGIGSGSRCYFIHQRLWQHCQHLSLRVLYGQEKGSTAKTRTIGTIEALLLMCEWHSRAIHFPPEHDGWDADISMRDTKHVYPESRSSAARRWLEDVAEPAKRSDRMAWMLANFALSLAYELNVFTESDSQATLLTSSGTSLVLTEDAWRRWRIQRLLYLYNNQLACRLGCMTSIPQTLSRLCTGSKEQRFPGKANDRADSLLMSMMSLTKFFKSMTDVLFPSVAVTKQLVKEDRYHGMLEQSLPLLDQWKQQHIDGSTLPTQTRAILEVEYYFVRAYTNSIGMQALCERNFADGHVFNHYSRESSEEVHLPSFEMGDANRVYVRNVVDSALAILQLVTRMGEAGTLRCAPVRVFLRITTAFVFLFKAISLGVNKHQLRYMLDIMDQAIAALHASAFDDMHLASHYASLLEGHLRRLRENLVVSTATGTKASQVAARHTNSMQRMQPESEGHAGVNSPNHGTNAASTDLPVLDIDAVSDLSSSNDWMFSLPFDPSMAPFGADAAPGFPPALDDGGLDFLWNLSE